MKAAELVRTSLDIASNKKSVYMLGAFGQEVSDAFILQKAKQLPSWYTSSKQAELRKLSGTGTRAFDCVGLIKSILWGWPSYKYQANGVPDIDEASMISRCSGVSSNFANIQAGEVVWLPGHIGVYIGGGLVVEATPKWANKVQVTALGNIGAKAGYNARTWTKHGKLPWIDYTAAAQTIRVGSKVKLTSSATQYGSTKNFASWVYSATLYVREISGGRVVISTQASGAVTGATQLSNLKLI